MKRNLLSICLMCQVSYGYFSPFIKLDTGITNVGLSIDNIESLSGPHVEKLDDLAGSSPVVGLSIGASYAFSPYFFVGISLGTQSNNVDMGYSIFHKVFNPTTYSLSDVTEAFSSRLKGGQQAGLLVGSAGSFGQFYMMPNYNRYTYENDVSVGANPKVQSKVTLEGPGLEIGLLSALTDNTSFGIKYAMAKLGSHTFTDNVRGSVKESISVQSPGVTLIQSF